MLERTMKNHIKKVSGAFKIVLLEGQRQVGKSTLLSGIAEPSRKYITLDNIKLRTLAKNDPELFLQQNPPPIIIDEVQYAPELFPFIKIYVDTHPTKTGSFWLTGSQRFILMQNVQESLAGRVAIIDLLGLSYREKCSLASSSKLFLPKMKLTKTQIIPQITPANVYKRIWEGSFPEPVLNKKLSREVYFNSYIQSYIERDVKDFYNISKPLQFYNFIVACAARTGSLINYASLARDIGIDLKTAQTWMGILERSGLVYLLQPYYLNVTKRLIKTPKLYFLDTGLCSYLTRWESPETLMNGAMDGAILETYVFGEILKSYWHNGENPLIYFYRDDDQKEIDFIIEKNMTLYPIEVKKTSNPQAFDFKNFRVLEKLGKTTGLGAVVCLQKERIPITRDVISIPVWEI
ncbi:ATPase [Spirochaetia bacterium]|nr:ATPase [Spirochaetia bacterium]